MQNYAPGLGLTLPPEQRARYNERVQQFCKLTRTELCDLFTVGSYWTLKDDRPDAKGYLVKFLGFHKTVKAWGHVKKTEGFDECVPLYWLYQRGQ